VYKLQFFFTFISVIATNREDFVSTYRHANFHAVAEIICNQTDTDNLHTQNYNKTKRMLALRLSIIEDCAVEANYCN